MLTVPATAARKSRDAASTRNSEAGVGGMPTRSAAKPARSAWRRWSRNRARASARPACWR